jgi:hypothetical protein
MTTVIAWSVHVSNDGDLVFNDPTIVASDNQMSSLKQGTGPDSILYRNFAALKSVIPGIDAVDFDDEDLWDSTTTVAFAKMLHGLGYEVTFCPLSDIGFWVGCLKQLNSAIPDLVTGFNLQCYSGGEGNDPGEWITAVKKAMGPSFPAQAFVRPGLWCANSPPSCTEGQCPDSIEQTFAGWRSLGLTGGWIWLLDDVIKCQDSGSCSGGPMGTEAYARAISEGLG